MRKNINLNWLRSFEAASRLLSFTAASQELGLTQSAVSQNIKLLELKLGEALFVRHPKSLELTDVGKAYRLSVRDGLETIDRSTNGLFGPNLASTISMRASMAFIAWISPQLGSFQMAHPDIGIKMVTSIWEGPSDSQPIDVDIVLAPHKHSEGNFEKLSDERIVPVCSLDMGGTIKSIDDIQNHNLIQILGFDDHWARYFSAFGKSHDSASIRLMTDTSVAAIEMASANLGCALVIERFAKAWVASGRALAIVGAPVELGQSHYFVRRDHERKKDHAVNLFEAWLQERLSSL